MFSVESDPNALWQVVINVQLQRFGQNIMWQIKDAFIPWHKIMHTVQNSEKVTMA